MNTPSNTLIESIRALFEPIVKVSSKWPPALAYGVPLIIAILLITLLRSALPSNLTLLVIITVLAPLAGYIYMDRDKRHLSMQLELARLSEKTMITGNVLFSDGAPVKGAKVFVDGVDRSKETDETGWFQIEVDRQNEWVIRATYKEQVDKMICRQKEAAQPIRIILKKSSKQALTISYSVKELDGCATTMIEDREYYNEGCKFRLQLSNTDSSRIIVDALNLLIIEYRPIPETLESKRDAGKMKFGQARVPHQLFLHLEAKRWHGYWTINKEAESETIDIDGRSDNLLDVKPPVVFDIEPGSAELIYGAVKTDQRGIYSFKFSIEYTSLDSKRKSVKTQPVRLLGLASKEGVGT